MIGRAAIIVSLLAAAAAPASAQSARERLEIAAGVSWFGAIEFPPVNATETTTGGTRRVVFRTQSGLESSAGVAVRVGLPVTSALTAESTLQLTNTTLATQARADIEGAPDITASEPVTQYLIEGGMLVRPVRWQRARLEPFVSAGGGYLRQLNEGRTFVETGSAWYAGGGARYLLTRAGRGRIKSSGLRLDLRLSVLNRGVALDDGRHPVPVWGGSVFVRF